jgi:hypothetical protein
LATIQSGAAEKITLVDDQQRQKDIEVFIDEI